MRCFVLDAWRRWPLTKPSTRRGPVPSPVAMHGPIGAKVSKPLQRVLRFLLLQIARGDVVHAGEPEDVVPRVSRGHAMRAPADDDAELGFVIDAADARRTADRIARPDHGRRRLDEQQRLGRQRLADFSRVILVVEADADDLRRPHRRQQRDARQPAAHRGAGGQPGERVAGGAEQLAAALDRVEAVTRPAKPDKSFPSATHSSPQRAVSTARADGGLALPALSTARTAYTYAIPGFTVSLNDGSTIGAGVIGWSVSAGSTPRSTM